MSDCDFDLHGLLRIRLVNAAPADAAAVGKQIGSPCGRPAGHADLTIRWVDRLELRGRVRVLGDHEVAFGDDAFVLLRGKHKSRLRVQIPFDRIGERCEIVCERGVEAVPLLVPIVNLMLLARGIVPIHASAFVHGGRGVLAAGWSKGGKTETLLSFLAQGAGYIADDWVYIDAQGGLYGIAEPIRLRAWHLDGLPKFRRRLGTLARTKLQTLRLADDWKDIWPRSRFALARMLKQVLHLLGRQAFVTVAPQQVCGDQHASQPASLDHLLLLVSHDSDEVAVEPIAAAEVAERMVFSVQHERDSLLAYYRMFRFAFPQRTNTLIENAEQLQRSQLVSALAGKPAHAVYHPYPVDISRLFAAIEPLLKSPPIAPQPWTAKEISIVPRADFTTVGSSV